MTLISRFDAASRSTTELHALYTKALRDFAAASRGSNARRDALATLEAIETALASRPKDW